MEKLFFFNYFFLSIFIELSITNVKCERNNEKNTKKNEKTKEYKKFNLKLINYFYIILQTHFTYIILLYKIKQIKNK